ncbi:hypothetical protein [Nocardioides convexus]|uniref:hypothetical protein n=1 Tax=Nocardioides convexus TaxID=2712224 RepID=UPI0024182BD6|nr:hypothetical protein [Nocardioides convexus]
MAKRNMPAAMKRSAWFCPLPPPSPATRTIEPRLPSIGIAFIATPAAPSLGWICGGGWICRLAAGHLGPLAAPAALGQAAGRRHAPSRRAALGHRHAVVPCRPRIRGPLGAVRRGR